MKEKSVFRQDFDFSLAASSDLLFEGSKVDSTICMSNGYVELRFLGG